MTGAASNTAAQGNGGQGAPRAPNGVQTGANTPVGAGNTGAARATAAQPPGGLGDLDVGRSSQGNCPSPPKSSGLPPFKLRTPLSGGIDGVEGIKYQRITGTNKTTINHTGRKIGSSAT